VPIYIYISIYVYVLRHICTYMYFYRALHHGREQPSAKSTAGWPRPIECLICMDHFSQKILGISGSLAGNDLNLRHPMGRRHRAEIYRTSQLVRISTVSCITAMFVILCEKIHTIPCHIFSHPMYWYMNIHPIRISADIRQVSRFLQKSHLKHHELFWSRTIQVNYPASAGLHH